MFRFINSRAIEAAVKRMVAPSMDALGRAIVEKAREYAPEDTGFLKSTIGYTYRQDTGQLQIHVDAHYGVFQEYGTKSIPPHPFLRPALQAAPSLWGRMSAVQFQFQTYASPGGERARDWVATHHAQSTVRLFARPTVDGGRAF